MKKLIIIPAYNEDENILEVLSELKSFTTEEFSLLVVNDCSTDNTLEICRQFPNVIVLDLPFNLGIGGAVQTGYRYAWQFDYDIAIQLDGDGQHDPKYLQEIVKPLINEECNMVIGTRFLEKKGFQSTGLRRLGIKIFQRLIRVLTKQKITDPTSGLRACDRQIIKLFANDYPRDYPEPETNARLLRLGFKIREIPVVMRERQGGESSIKLFQPIYYMIKVSLAICIDYLRGSHRRC